MKVDTVYIVYTVYIEKYSGDENSSKKARYINRWNKLIPSYSKVQFAGSMGVDFYWYRLELWAKSAVGDRLVFGLRT